MQGFVDGVGDAVKPLIEPFLANEKTTAPTGTPSKRSSAASKTENLLKAAAENVQDKNEALGQCLRVTAPVASGFIRVVVFALPFISLASAKLYRLYVLAPKNLLKMLYGAALCFFGGTFVASIAAIEAFRQMGWQRTYADLQVIWNDVQKIGDANAKDDEADEDRDGKADVDQLSAHELGVRKIVLAMQTVEDPKKLETALGSLWAAYVAVLATLRLQFAQTLAIALGLYDQVRMPLLRFFAPPLMSVLAPKKLEKWAETILDTTAKFVGVLLAWYLQMVISAFYSGLRGGRMFALSLCDLCVERGWTEYLEKIPGVVAPFDPDTTYLDEVIGYSIGALGIFWQLSSAFSLPFPLSLLLLPLEIVEWLLRWQMTFGRPDDLPTAAAGR